MLMSSDIEGNQNVTRKYHLGRFGVRNRKNAKDCCEN
jgi:hypothetical protein